VTVPAAVGIVELEEHWKRSSRAAPHGSSHQGVKRVTPLLG
jgi:hypothetical protein